MSDLWFIITPVYKPAPGGGAVYTDTLGRALAATGADVVVATEAFPGEPERQDNPIPAGSLRLARIFPHRAGRAEKDWRSHLSYAVQNIKMLGLPALLRSAIHVLRPDHVNLLIHSSFFYKPSLLPTLLPRLRSALPGETTMIVDVRDPLFPDAKLPLLARFDAAVGCSRGIADQLRESLPAIHVAHIPIPFEAPDIGRAEDIEQTMRKYGLVGERYIFNPNGITDSKGYRLILAAVRALRRRPGFEEVVLAVIGRARDWSREDDAAQADGVLRYIGLVPNEEGMRIASGGLATAVIGKNEGLPRSALESLSMGRPTLVPDLPEFRDAIPGSIVRSDDPEEIADQLIVLVAKGGQQTYPVENHGMDRLTGRYLELSRTASGPTGDK